MSKSKLSDAERKRLLDEQVEESKQRLREQRTRNFAVEVTSVHDVWLYDDELAIRVTQNGRQWDQIVVTPAEAQHVIDAIAAYLAERAKETKQ